MSEWVPDSLYVLTGATCAGPRHGLARAAIAPIAPKTHRALRTNWRPDPAITVCMTPKDFDRDVGKARLCRRALQRVDSHLHGVWLQDRVHPRLGRVGRCVHRRMTHRTPLRWNPRTASDARQGDEIVGRRPAYRVGRCDTCRSPSHDRGRHKPEAVACRRTGA